MVINYGFTSPVRYTEPRAELTLDLEAAFTRVLHKRTYFDQIVKDLPYDDAYATTDARMYLQAAFACNEMGLHAEALAWYRAADVVFCGEQNSSSIVGHDLEVHMQIMDTDNPTTWHIVCDALVVTPYGNRNEDIILGTVEASRLLNGQAFFDRLGELRDYWFERTEEARATYKRLNKSFTYDN